MPDSKQRKPVPPSLAQRVAGLLRSELAASKSELIPSLRELAAHFGVSWVTMTRAAAILRGQGVIWYTKGRRPRRGATPPLRAGNGPVRAAKQSAAILADIIRNQIESGELKSGQTIPKVSFFTSTYRVSSHTVVASLRQLLQERLISREGKTYQVGPGVQARAPLPRASHPVLLIAARRESSWRELLISERTSNFCRFFSSEAQRFAVELHPVLYERDDFPEGLLTAGRHEMARLVNRLGSRYAGSLLLGSVEEIGDISSWIDFFRGFRKPCVWFDRAGDGDTSARRAQFVACRFSERKAVALAMGHLHQIGHKTVCYLNPGDGEWEDRRLSLVKDEARSRGMNVVAYPPSDPDGLAQAASLRQDIMWQFDSVAYYRQLYDSICRKQTGVRTRYPDFPRIDRLSGTVDRVMAVTLWSVATVVSNTDPDFEEIRAFRYAWMFARHLRHRDVTAIIAPNDHRARRYYYHLRGLGIRVPEEMSLISFDNYPELQPLPVTTVDFGFDHLGYCAFHSIISDVPLRKSAGGELFTQPRIVHAGSLAPPRRGPLKAVYRAQ